MSNVDRECTTHHYSCPCREKVLQDYIRAKEVYNTSNEDNVMENYNKYLKAWEALKRLKHE